MNINNKDFNKMNSSQIANIIDSVLEGVEKSKLGSIYLKNSKGENVITQDGIPICIQANLNCFLTILNCYFPKNYDSTTTLTTKD